MQKIDVIELKTNNNQQLNGDLFSLKPTKKHKKTTVKWFFCGCFYYEKLIYYKKSCYLIKSISLSTNLYNLHK